MSRAIGWCVLALLAACSGGEDAAPSNQLAAGPGPASNVTSDPGGARSIAPAVGLTASVSALSGDTSDLSVRVTDLGTIIDLPADALFEYDRATLTPAAETELRKAADLIEGAGQAREILLSGKAGQLLDRYVEATNA